MADGPDAGSDPDRADDREPVDVAVVGGGAAGLAAALFTARQGLDTLVFDRGPSAIRRSYLLENVLGFPGGIDPETYLALGREQVRHEGGRLRDAMVVGVERRDATGADGETDGAADAPPVGDGFVVRTDEGPAVAADAVVAASAYDGDYLADLAGLDHAVDDHPVSCDPDGTTAVDGLYVAGWLSGGPHQVLACAGHGARVGKTLVRERRRADGFWPGVDEFWDWSVEAGTYGDEEWERQVDDWVESTLPADHDVDPARAERVKEAVKDERLGFERTAEQRRERLATMRAAVREHLLGE
jgi:thioredoxin reductase (NADPH)